MIVRRQDIENAIRQMTAEELAEFRDWFIQFDAESWDRQFENDVALGRLDGLADEALKDAREGRSRDL